MKFTEVRQTSPQLPGGWPWCWWAQQGSRMLLLEQCGRCEGCNAFESHVSLVSLSLLIRCHAFRLGFFGVLASLRSWLRLHTRRICSSLYAGVFLPYGAARTYALCNVVGYILELRRPRDRRAWNKRESTRVSASGHWSSAGERDVEREHRASSVCTLFPAFCDWTWLG